MHRDFFPKIFERILPRLWHKRPAIDADRNDAALANISDTDRVYRMLMDHAYVALENAARRAIQPNTEGLSREFLAGRAQSLAELIESIEALRGRAKDLALAEERRRAQAR